MLQRALRAPPSIAVFASAVQAFEIEELMHSKAAALAVRRYLFARLEERFDGAPTLLKASRLSSRR